MDLVDIQQQQDLTVARKAGSICPKLMNSFWNEYTGNVPPERRRLILDEIKKDPNFCNAKNVYKSRDELLFQGFLRVKLLVGKKDRLGWTEREFLYAQMLLGVNPIFIHSSLVIPLLNSQGTKEQSEEWVPKAENLEILTAYAQTELAHGSDLSQLATVAEYNPSKQQFIINSGSFTGSKWWIGGAGISATHVILQARLVTRGVDYGPHLFFVQIRDSRTLEPLPGVACGDIGPKVYGGFAAVDNGWISFSNVAVPRNAMLMKWAKVEKDGTYIPPQHPKLGFGGMLMLRSQLVIGAASALSKAVTISIRYCHVRRQFKFLNNEQESPVISYSMVQHRLFPILAQTYAIHFAGCRMLELFARLQAELSQGETASIALMHTLSCGLKSLTTEWAASGVEEARKVMGGHGFSAFSGFGQLFADYVPSNTYEGENYLLTQQVAKYLLKNPLDENVSGDKFSKLFSQRVQKMTTSIQLKLLSQEQSWNQVQWDCSRLSRAFSELFILESFQAKLEESSRNPRWLTLNPVLRLLYETFAIHTILCNTGEFLELELLEPSAMEPLRSEFKRLLERLLPETAGLVDAFDHDDFVLNSELGRADGRAYAGLWSRKSTHADNFDANATKDIIKEILNRKVVARL